MALWEIIVGIQLVLFGIAAMSASNRADLKSALRGILFIIGLGSLIIGISALLLARGYVLGRESARRRGRSVAAFAIAFALLGAMLLPAKLSPDSPFLTILMNIVILLYLGSDGVVAYFRGGSKVRR